MFTPLFNRNGNARTPLTLDEIRYRAPSVFATSPIEGVSNEYRFIPTSEILQTLMADGWQPVQAGEHRVRKAGKQGYQKHMIRFRNPNLPMVGDNEVDLIAYNSHDRTSCFKFLAGLYRMVCANGMCVGEDLFAPISVRHIGFKAENVLAAAYRVVEAIPQVTQSVGAMQAIQLTGEERVAFAEAAVGLKYDVDAQGKSKSPVKPGALLNPRRGADQKDDLWTTLNVVQENLLKGGQRGWSTSRGRMRRQSTREVGSITESTKLNQALWTLAEKMKALKTGAAA